MHVGRNLQLDGTVPFGPSNILAVPNSEGIYIIHDLRGSGYIGRSTNLRQRFEHHLRRTWNPELNAFLRTGLGPLQLSWIATEESRTLERSLVRLLNPPANRVRFHLGTEKSTPMTVR